MDDVTRRGFLARVGLLLNCASMDAAIAIPDLPHSQQSLLDAIRLNPDSDAPRLAYANWFDQQGHPLGKLIRTQCEIAKLTPADAAYYDLTSDEFQLSHPEGHYRTSNLGKWITEQSGESQPIELSGEFRRGMLELVWLFGPDDNGFIDAAPEIFRRAPALNALLCWRFPDSKLTHKLLTTKEMERIIDLRLWSCAINDESMALLATSDNLNQLTRLDIQSSCVGSSGISRILADGALNHLRSLALNECASFNCDIEEHFKRVDSNSCDDDYFHRVLLSSHASRLESLVLRPVEITDSALKLWCNLDNRRLKRLRLFDCRATKPQLATFMKSRVCSQIEKIHLELTSDSLLDGIDWSKFIRLKKLILKCDSAGFESFARTMPHGLVELEIRGAIGDDGASALANAPNLQSLRVLELSHSSIGAAGATALARSPHLGNVVHLSLSVNPIGDDGAAAIAEGQIASSLACLKICSTEMTDVGLIAIANSTKLRNLRWLSMENGLISEAVSEALANSKYLSRIRKLRVHGVHAENTIPNFAALLSRYGADVFKYCGYLV